MQKSVRILIIVMLLAMMVLSTQAQERQPLPGTLVFHETFDNNARDWELDSNWNIAGLVSNLINGTYRIEYPASCATCFWMIVPGYDDISLAPVLDDTFALSMDVWNVSSNGDEGYAVGIIWHVQPPVEGLYRDYYRVSYSADGRWRFIRRTQENGTRTLASGAGMPINFDDGAVHNLQLHVNGQTAALVIDGVPMASMADSSGLLPLSGRVGFLVGAPVGTVDDLAVYSATFDNLAVYDG